MIAELRELWKFRELLATMVERDLKIRYKNSVLGFFWSLLNPLATVLVLTLVFEYIAGIGGPNYSAYILAAILPYLFFQQSILDAAMSVLGNVQLIKKIYFPREILPLAAVVSNLIHFLLALGVFFVFLLVVWIANPGPSPFQWTAIFLPFLIVVNLALALGIALIVSALNAFYEDVKYIAQVVLYLLFYLCPIVYFSEQVMARTSPMVSTLFHLNPMATLCTAYRKLLLAPQPVNVGGGTVPASPIDLPMLGIATLVSFVVLIFGYSVFNRMKWRFVERP
jgi:ABC-type polysaccharide/polyol phosphate export permease